MRVLIPAIILLLCCGVVAAEAPPPVMADDLETGASDLDEAVSEDRGVLLARQRELETAGAETTNDPVLQQQYIDTVAALGFHDLAAEQYERLLAASPDTPELLHAVADAWMKTGPYGRDKAHAALQRALTLNENDVHAHLLLGLLTHREGLYDRAEHHYNTVLEHDPENTRARLGSAVLLARAGEIMAASALLDDIGAAARHYDVETRVMLRNALYVFERHGGWFEDTAENHAAYGRLLYRAGRIMDALPAVRHATTRNPGDYESLNFLAAMQLQIGNLEQAAQAYAESLQANPDQPAIESTRRQLINELTLRQQDKAP